LDISEPIKKSDIGGFSLILEPEGRIVKIKSLLPLFPQFVATGLLF